VQLNHLYSSDGPPFVPSSPLCEDLANIQALIFQPPSFPFNKSKPLQPLNSTQLHLTYFHPSLAYDSTPLVSQDIQHPIHFNPNIHHFFAEVLPNPIQTYHGEFHSNSSQYHHCPLKLWMTSAVKLHPSFFY
jgi:hypothetical protein